MGRKRRRRGPARCRHCRSPIAFYRLPTSRRFAPFNPKPVDPFAHLAYPVMDRNAWDPNDLIAEIQVMRGVDADAAYEEVRDLDWHQRHRCAQGRYAWQTEHQEATP